MGMTLGAAVAVAGLVMVGLAIRWFVKAKGSAGKRVGAVLVTVLGLAAMGGGVWYGLYGAGYSKVEKAKRREAGKNVEKMLATFSGLLERCRDEVFPQMDYKPSEAAKAEKYKTAIEVMTAELKVCYTGSSGMGEEKGAELDQIKWLIADQTCAGFAKRLIKERTFCPQMIEVLVEKAKFQDPAAGVEPDKKKGPDEAAVKAMQPLLDQLKKKLDTCHAEALKIYKPPKDLKAEEAKAKAIGAIMQALGDCAKGKGGEELKPEHLNPLLKETDCAKFAAAMRKLEACSAALEAPTKAGFTFDEAAAAKVDEDGKKKAGGAEDKPKAETKPAEKEKAPRKDARPAAMYRRPKAASMAAPRPK